jgi:hypothetical protein
LLAGWFCFGCFYGVRKLGSCGGKTETEITKKMNTPKEYLREFEG